MLNIAYRISPLPVPLRTLARGGDANDLGRFTQPQLGQCFGGLGYRSRSECVLTSPYYVMPIRRFYP